MSTRGSIMRQARWCGALLLACLSWAAHADTRAWLDRDRIALGETTTLNIETDGAVDAPDWGPLAQDFEVSGHTSRRQAEFANGRRSTRSLFGVALRPRREGVLTVPALQVGAARTAPLSLSVAPATVTAARDGAPAFIEADIDVQSPYVQQSLGYVLRLHYATPLVSGSLEQPAPEGASMQRIGNDVQYSREVGGRRYSVVERRYQIVPERSGTLTIPGARFEGQGAGGGFFDDMFNRGPRRLAANGPPSVLAVRTMPGGAPQPWLPVYGVDVRWLEAPTEGRAGEASTFVLEAVFDGAVGTQLPEIALPAPAGAQIFAEPPQYDERFDDGRPSVRLTRRYAVVPRAGGVLRVAGPRIDWWDVRAGVARTAAAPAVTLSVSGAAAAPVEETVDVGTPAVRPTPAATPLPGVWPGIAAVFAALWLATAWLAWRLHRRQARSRPGQPGHGDGTAPPGPDPARTRRQLMQVLRTGEPAEVEHALRALHAPSPPDLDALAALLEDPAQREAVTAWQRARWAGGDLGGARQGLCAAFRGGAGGTGQSARRRGDASLPPLYPEH